MSERLPSRTWRLRDLALTLGVLSTGVVGAGILGGCVGAIGDDGGSVDDGPGVKPEGSPDASVSGMRRLTRVEYTQTIHDLLGVEIPLDVERLPIDPLLPFDNDYREQEPSDALVEASDALAQAAAEWVATEPDVLDAVVGCTPTGPSDADCMRAFVTRFGRRALRRPLTEAEIANHLAFQSFSVEESDFYSGARMSLQAFLTHPEFLYRIEIGTPTTIEGVSALNDFEIATRLSYLLRGSTPDDALLDIAETGLLRDSATRKTVALELLQTPAAKKNLERFHAMWLGYEKFAAETGIVSDMLAESSMLVDRVVFEERGTYTSILTTNETWITPALAENYGLAMPSGEGAWIAYDAKRAGILSHGSVMAAGAKATDSSPTRRGKFVQAQLLCQSIPLPKPELGVDVDATPQSKDPNACKTQRYAEHRDNPECSGCHALMDPIGFGLENYDLLGRYRETELDRPDCAIDGQGSVAGVGDFVGPAELGKLVLDSGSFEACVSRQLYRFAVGRALDDADDEMVSRLEDTLVTTDDLVDTLMAIVTADAFAQRREEPWKGEE